MFQVQQITTDHVPWSTRWKTATGRLARRGWSISWPWWLEVSHVNELTHRDTTIFSLQEQKVPAAVRLYYQCFTYFTVLKHKHTRFKVKPNQAHCLHFKKVRSEKRAPGMFFPHFLIKIIRHHINMIKVLL